MSKEAPGSSRIGVRQWVWEKATLKWSLELRQDGENTKGVRVVKAKLTSKALYEIRHQMTIQGLRGRRGGFDPRAGRRGRSALDPGWGGNRGPSWATGLEVV